MVIYEPMQDEITTSTGDIVSLAGVIHVADSTAPHARSFLYPSLAPTTGYSLRGYPVKLRRAGEYLVALSKPEPNADVVGLDVVRIPR